MLLDSNCKIKITSMKSFTNNIFESLNLMKNVEKYIIVKENYTLLVDVLSAFKNRPFSDI